LNEIPAQLKDLLRASGVETAGSREIDHGTQYRLARGSDEAVLNVYSTGRVSVGGKPSGLRDLLEGWRVAQGGKPSGKRAGRPPASALPRVGTDEAGKGDYFGPLVVAGVRVLGTGPASRLEEIGVRDSKVLGTARARSVAGEILAAVGEENVLALSLGPREYEERRLAAGSVSKLLGELHAEIIAGLREGTELAVVDAFGPRTLVEQHLPAGVELEMRPKAEDDAAVAAASILARARFLEALDALSAEVGFELPRGATHVLEAARRIVDSGGCEALERVAKVHFATTAAILEGTRENR
jgi:ribonuclease HIII